MSQTIKLIDIGANLTDPVFRGIYKGKQLHADDFQHMLHRATLAGVEKIIVTGGNLEESKKALELARQHSQLYCTVGTHPTRCSEFEEYPGGPDLYYKELLELAKDGKRDNKVVAVGEIGLDYDREQFCPRHTQKLYFEKQLQLATELQLPLFLHNRKSTQDFVEILSSNSSNWKDYGGVVHSWTDSQEDLNLISPLGLYIGVNGCSLKTKENLDVLKQIPVDKLMLETDAPWCDIRSTHAGHEFLSSKNLSSLPWIDTQHWSKKESKHIPGPDQLVKSRNEPCIQRWVLRIVSQVKEISEQELAHQVYENTTKIFFPKQ